MRRYESHHYSQNIEIVLSSLKHTIKMIATAIAVAFVVYSCKGKLAEAEKLDLSSVPLQTINDMFAVQTKNGVVVMRIEADLMERFALCAMCPAKSSVQSWLPGS